MPHQAPTQDWRQSAWIAALMLGSLVFTLGFACAVPLAAFAACAALSLPRLHAVTLIVGVWLINQIVGFGMLHYPINTPTLAWGGILGAIAIAATLAPTLLPQTLRPAPRAALAFLAAFAVYEGGLYLISLTIMGGAQDYTAAIVARIFALNAASALALALLHQAARAVGLPTPAPAR